jgi:hypothetical protein
MGRRKIRTYLSTRANKILSAEKRVGDDPEADWVSPGVPRLLPSPPFDIASDRATGLSLGVGRPRGNTRQVRQIEKMDLPPHKVTAHPEKGGHHHGEVAAHLLKVAAHLLKVPAHLLKVTDHPEKGGLSPRRGPCAPFERGPSPRRVPRPLSRRERPCGRTCCAPFRAGSPAAFIGRAFGPTLDTAIAIATTARNPSTVTPITTPAEASYSQAQTQTIIDKLN